LPYEEFKLFSDREQGFYLRPEYREQAIAAAEKLLDKKIRCADRYRLYALPAYGQRQYYEGLYFERREDIMTLAGGEAYEGAERFTDRILDLVWMMLEESAWVIPAYINPRPGDTTRVLPYSYYGARIAYEPSLDFTVEEVDCSWPETRVIPERWDTDTIYRIRLRGTLEAGKAQKFTLKITK
jgi:hypothetical protein